ncbi:glycosyltransferase [Roseivivax sp. CAU 1761]
MRDFASAPGRARPIGFFVHHQGRGHAERVAALVHALPPDRPVRIFCARPEIFPALPETAEIARIPSLFEPEGPAPAALDRIATPETLHCAPLGWRTIREAMAEITTWFWQADPALMVCDVSAEIAQLARICSVPHVKVLQHGDRSDPGHRAAYDGAAGLLAPFDAALAQPDWDEAMQAKTFFAGGLGIDCGLPDRAVARRRLGLAEGEEVALAISGGGGNGMPEAPLGVAARSFPAMRWITIGAVQREWHATPPRNLEHRGWVENAADFIAAADLVVASTGNTTAAQLLAAGKPWIAVPEWRYFDEQVAKAEALARAGAALHLPALPASAHRWREAVAQVRAGHDPDRQRRLIRPDAARRAAAWLDALATSLWQTDPETAPERTLETHA